jgi:hypothetical protein
MPLSNVVFFDGVDDYVNCGHDVSLDLTVNLTLCARIKKYRSHSFFHNIVGKNTGLADATTVYMLYTQNVTGEVKFSINNGIGGALINSSGYNLKLNQWTYVVGVLSAGFLKVYIDGNKTLTDIVRTKNPQSQPNWDVMAGGNSFWPSSTPCYMSEAQIYNRDLSDEEVLYNWFHPSNPKRRGLVLNLTQDSIYGPQWVDLSGNANHGTYVGGAVPVTANRLAGR